MVSYQVEKNESISRVQLFASSWTGLPGSSLHGISQAGILEWVTFPSPGDLPDPGIKSRFSSLQVDSSLSESPGKTSFKRV